MPDIPQMSLKVGTLQFPTFTPAEYKPQVADATLLPRSLQIQEARDKEARQNVDVIDSSLAVFRNALNKDEYSWLQEKADKIRTDIDAMIANGNTESAVRFAQEAARDLKRDTELADKIKVNEIYQKEVDKVKSMNVSDDIKEMWLAENRYSYNGVADWKAKWNVVADVNLSSLMQLAASMTPEDAQSRTNRFTRSGDIIIDKDGNVTADTKSAYYKQASTSVGGQTSRTTHIKTRAAMEKNLRNIMSDPNVKASLLQKYRATKWKLDDSYAKMNDVTLDEKDRQRAAETYNEYAKIFANSDGIVVVKNYDDWINKKVVTMLNDMEYNNTATTSESETSRHYGEGLFVSNANRDRGTVNADIAKETASVKGNNIDQIFYNSAQAAGINVKNEVDGVGNCYVTPSGPLQ